MREASRRSSGGLHCCGFAEYCIGAHKPGKYLDVVSDVDIAGDGTLEPGEVAGLGMVM